ncbi:TetR family transcriptional regulator [Streptomyces sp. NPDC088184]|uniref:TetR/AcrR family transcriptional regulator n=1 Tax=unclassified Streptomyces TaxID=2593676 RepID=UPI00343335FB
MTSGQATASARASGSDPASASVAARASTRASVPASASAPTSAPASASTPVPVSAPAPDPVRSAADPGSGRDAILRAARRAFTQRPYAEVTIRGIAADAGVSPSLVVKHFGRKEELFNTVADFGPAAAELLDAPLATLGRHLVVTLVSRRRERQSDPLLRVVFSLGNRDERSLLRDRFHEQVTDALTARLHGRERALRAELIAGHLLGLGATLSLHRDGAGADATPEHIADLYAPALQSLIDG